MRSFFKYFFWFLSSGTLVIFYFLNTPAGHQNLGYLVEDFLSKKTYNKIKVDSLNIEQYPYIEMQLQVNDTANVTLKGEVDKYNIDMYYHVVGDSFTFNDFHLEDKIDVEGDFSGAFSSLRVRGDGSAFEGGVNYSFTKIPTKIKEMNVVMKQVNSEKLLKFLKQEPHVTGLADVDAQFQTFSKYEKEGSAKIYMDKVFISKFVAEEPFVLNTTIDFKNIVYQYKGTLESDRGRLVFKNGEYNKSTKVAQADYKLHLKELGDFEKLLKRKYKGSLDTQGSVIYDKGLEIKGDTQKFGGELKYVYKKENIDLKLKALSLEKMLHQFSYPVIFSSNVYGEINYNMKDKIVLINTDLKETRFRKTKLTNMLYTASGINLLSEVYDKSSFSGGYQNSILSSLLKIDNGKSHIYLTHTKMDAISNKINSKFEVKMQGQEIYGDIYGTLQDPKVSVDMKKLLKYQMNKQLGSLFGTDKQETIKKELKSIDIDDVTNTAKSLMDSFF